MAHHKEIEMLDTYPVFYLDEVIKAIKQAWLAEGGKIAFDWGGEMNPRSSSCFLNNNVIFWINDH